MSGVAAGLITVKVKPGARRESIKCGADNIIICAVQSPPVDGKANERLIELLAQVLHVRPSAITIIRGQTARIKRVMVAGMESAEVLSILIHNQK